MKQIFIKSILECTTLISGPNWEHPRVQQFPGQQKESKRYQKDIILLSS